MEMSRPLLNHKMVIYFSARSLPVHSGENVTACFVDLLNRLAGTKNLSLHIGLTSFNFHDIASRLTESVTRRNLPEIENIFRVVEERAIIEQIRPDWVIYFNPDLLDIYESDRPYKVATFVSDLRHLECPFSFTPEERLLRDSAISLALDSANVVIALPEVSGVDLAQFFDFEAKQIKTLHVLPEGSNKPGVQTQNSLHYDHAAAELLAMLERLAGHDEFQEITVREPLRVSIVTPAYQQGRFLKSCIDSVLSQDYPHIEYFVLDGGSTDCSREILESYKDRFFWKSEPDGGQAAAINCGLLRAQGTILAYLNSDDVLLPGAVSSVVSEWERRPSVDVFFGNAHYINEAGEIIGDYDTREFDLDAFKEQCFICQPAAFWHRRVVEHIGLLDESYQVTMDYEYWQRLAAHRGLFVRLDRFLACSRDYATTKTRLRRSQVYKENFRSQWKHWGYISPQWWRGWIDHLKSERLVFWRSLLPSWKKSEPLSRFLSRHARKIHTRIPKGGGSPKTAHSDRGHSP